MTERAKVVLGKKVDTGKNICEERFQMLMKLIRIHRMMRKDETIMQRKIWTQGKQEN